MKKMTDDEFLEWIGNRLKGLREEAGLTQQELADRINATQTDHLHKIELDFLLGKNIKRLREEKELSQEQLAVLAGVPLELLQNLEAGTAEETSMLDIYRIARPLDVWLDALYKKD